MPGDKRSSLFKLIFVMFWALIAVYLFPFFSQVLNLRGIDIADDNFLITVSRSVLFAISSSLLIVVVSYGVSLLLNKIEVDSKPGKILSLSLLPIILGNVTTAYIFKSTLADTQLFGSILRSGVVVNYFLLAIIQIWQFGFLFVYVFWLNHKSISKSKLEFLKSAKTGSFNRLKDLYFPFSKNLIILFLLIGFIFNIYEEAKAYYIFKFSQGTNTELINHWLFRNYQSELVVNAAQANFKLLTYSLIVFLAVSTTSFLLLVFLRLILERFSEIRPMNTNADLSKRSIGKIVIALGAFSLLFPITYALLISSPTFDFALSFLLYPLGLTSLVSMIATFFAILISISFRQLFPRTYASFNTRSSVAIIIIFSLLLIPPIVIMLCGYKWNAYLLDWASSPTVFIWMIAHIILLLPLLISFLIVTHFAITNNELEYMRIYSQTPGEIVKINYLKRFRGQYLLTFFFSIGVVWNEDTINKMLSDFIPSFVNGLEMMISGKSADISRASGYLFVSLLISIICVSLWHYLFNVKLSSRR